VRLKVPSGSVVEVSAATPLLLNVFVPNVVPPFENVTVPVGAGLPDTVALSTTGSPWAAVVGLATSAVVVPAVVSTVKVCVTGVAGAYVVLPDWDAVMLQVPPVKKVAVLPETVQTNGVFGVYATARPELAVAFNVSGVPRD